MRNPANATRLAQARTRPLYFPGIRIRTNSPASGAKRIKLSRCWSILVSHVVAEERQRADHDEERVGLDAAGLQDANRIAEHLHEERGEPNRAVDDPGVPPHRHAGAESRQPA